MSEIKLTRGSDLQVRKESEFPKVYWHKGRLWLDLEDGRDYEVPTDPIKVLGFVDHFSEKTWVTTRWLRDAIRRIAREAQAHTTAT
jgi:hypothetical protein